MIAPRMYDPSHVILSIYARA